jgi:hypothetical protein
MFARCGSGLVAARLTANFLNLLDPEIAEDTVVAVVAAQFGE